MAILIRKRTRVSEPTITKMRGHDPFDGLIHLDVENQLDEPIYLVNDLGGAQVFPPSGVRNLPHGMREVVITVSRRIGKSAVRDPRGKTLNPADVAVQTIRVPEDMLQRGCQYLPGVMFVVTSGRFLSSAVAMHPASRAYREQEARLAFKNGESDGGFTPLSIKANFPNSTVDRIYVAADERIMAVPVTNDPHSATGITVSINDGCGVQQFFVKKDELVGDWTEQLIGDSKWLMSFDRAALAVELRRRRDRAKELLTESEVDIKVQEALEEKNYEAKMKDRDAARLQRDLDGTKKDLALVSADLNRAIDPEEKSYAQETLAIKRDSQKLATEMEKIKADAVVQNHSTDLAIAEAKLAKETTSARAAEFNSLAVLAKAAVAVVPIVAGMLIVTRAAGSACLVATTTSKLISGGAKLLSGVTTVAGKLVYLFKNGGSLAVSAGAAGFRMIRNVFSTGCSIAGSLIRTCGSVIASVAKYVANIISTVTSTICDAVGNFVDWAFG